MPLAFLAASSGSRSPQGIRQWTDGNGDVTEYPSGLEGEGKRFFEVKIAKLNAPCDSDNWGLL